MEKSSRKVLIRHAYKAYHAYRDMIIHYAMLNVLRYAEEHPELSLMSLSSLAGGERNSLWTNLGGQLMKTSDVDALRSDIGSGTLSDWQAIHRRYDELWARYPQDKLIHSLQALRFVYGADSLTEGLWLRAIEEEKRIRDYICEQVYQTRRKDYLNPFRRATYRNEAEMISAIGPLEQNGFVQQIRTATLQAKEQLSGLKIK